MPIDFQEDRGIDFVPDEVSPPKLIDPSTVKLSPSELAKMEPGYRPMGIVGPLEPQELLEIPKLAQIPGAVLEPVANAAEDLMSDLYRRTGFDPSSQPGVSPITMESYPITAGGPAGWALRKISPKTAADIDKGAADIIKGFTTPGQQLMLPAAGVSKPLGKLFGASMIGDVPEAVKQIAEEGAVGIPRLAVDIGGGAGFLHGIPERAAAPIPQRAVVPTPVTGRALKIAKGAEVPPVAPVEVTPEPAKPPPVVQRKAEPSPIPPAAPTSEVTENTVAKFVDSISSGDIIRTGNDSWFSVKRDDGGVDLYSKSDGSHRFIDKDGTWASNDLEGFESKLSPEQFFSDALPNPTIEKSKKNLTQSEAESLVGKWSNEIDKAIENETIKRKRISGLDTPQLERGGEGKTEHIESYGEKYIRELGEDAARKRIDHLNTRTQEELSKRPIDQSAIRRLQQEAQNIANALDKPKPIPTETVKTAPTVPEPAISKPTPVSEKVQEGIAPIESGLFVKIENRDVYPVASLEEASKKVKTANQIIVNSGDELPNAIVVDAQGNQVGRISPNGNIWDKSGELIHNATGLEKTKEGKWDIPQKAVDISTKTEPTPPPAPVKEPWEMTREEFLSKPPNDTLQNQAFGGELPAWSWIEGGKEHSATVNELPDAHARSVRRAIEQGKPVPETVLADYPELKKASVAPKRNMLPAEKEFFDAHGITIKEAVESRLIVRNKVFKKDGTERVVGYSPASADSYTFTKAIDAANKEKEIRAKRKSEIDPDKTLREQVWSKMTDQERRTVRQNPKIFEKPEGALDWEFLRPYAEQQGVVEPRTVSRSQSEKDTFTSATTPPTPIPEGPGAAPVGMGGAVGSEFQAQQPMRTATKNAAVDRDRADRGLPPMMDALRKSDPELWSQAMNIINEDWQAADKLIARFRDRPFIPTDVETMILLHRRVDLKNEFAKAQREFNAANTEGRPEAAATARVVRDEMSSKLGELDAMMGRGDQSAGTMAGRAFRARQLVMNEDYSLEQLVRDREGNLGRKLTDSEMSELEKQAKAWEEKSIALEKRVGELQKERDTLDSKLIAKQAELDAAKPTASSYVIGLAEKIVKDWDTRADAARARIKERMGRMSAGVDPTILIDLSEIGLSHLGHVGLDFAKWSEKMIGDVGEWAKPHLERVWERSQKLADRDIAKRAPKQAAKVKDAIVKPEPDIAQKIGENVTRKLAKNPNADLAWPARQLARHFWKSGVREPQALVDAVHEVLVKAKPELTRRQTMDILSGYGAYKLLSKEAIKVALRDIFGQLQQIGKLEDMAAGKAPSKSGFERRTPSDIERRLIKQVEEKKKEGGYNVTDPETQLRTAMQAAQRRLENQIKDLEHEISTRTKIVKKRTKLEYDAKTKALQERRDALKEIHDEIFKPAPMTEAERLALWKKRTLEKIEDYKDRIASGDVMPRKRPEPPRLDPEAIKIRYELHKVHNAIMDIRLQDELSKRTTAKKAIDAAANAIRFSRAVMTGGEFSGVLRQGGFIGFGRPILAAKNLWPMFKALMSEEAQFKINEEIQTRPNAPLYSRFKLDLTESGVRLSSMEEHYMFTVSKRLEKIWGVKHSVRFLAAFQRAYTTFLNRLRADTFDAMADVYGTDKVTGEQIANFINVATGRGSTGIGKLVGPGANAVFFAPRYSISRFQLLMGQPLWHGNAKTRAMILKQYGRALAGASVVYSLGMMAGGTVETDPRHPDSGKIKMGNTRIDPLAGLAQVTRLMATEASGKRVTGKGKEIPIRGKVPYGNPSGWDVAATFARQKLSPAVGAAASFAAGKDPVGKPFKMTDAMIQTLTPITYGDVLAAMEEQGVPRGTAIGVLAIFGMGVQTYDTNQKRER